MSDVGVPAGSGRLGGIITIPSSAKGIVIFAHGSGSSRLSPRNQYVSKVLNESGIATLLVDLLTVEEAIEDEKTRKLRFDIELLSGRLAAVTEWVLQEQETKNLRIGYFGASTGAAATLIAAVQFPGSIKAIVSRGGRVDLAGSVFKKLNSDLSILFLVGSNDPQTVNWNQKAIQQLKQVTNRRLVLVQGAGHTFDEEGTMEEVAKHTCSWFERYLQ